MGRPGGAEGVATPGPCYGLDALRSWTTRIAELWQPGEDVFVYFNNDPPGRAVRDAALLARLAERAGLDPTRTPGPRSIRVG